jgi:diaminopimelate decarboxylase
MNRNYPAYHPEPQQWGLDAGPDDELRVGGISAVQLAGEFGTPLHVVHEARLESGATDFLSAFSSAYPGNVSVHYAFKCNPVPGVLDILHRRGMKAEVMSRFELALALRLGFAPEEIVVNGPFKPDALLEDCLRAGVRLVIADSIEELQRLERLAAIAGRRQAVLLRVNPDYTPRGMNSGTATGSRKACAFGLDLYGGEVQLALHSFSEWPNLDFKGLHFHIGSGIRHPDDYRQALLRLKPLVFQVRQMGYEIAVLDIGGGFGAPLSREMTTWEMLWYQASRRLSSNPSVALGYKFEDFAAAVVRGMSALFPDGRLPELVAEPGRSITSPCQMLLLRIHAVKSRPGVHTWLITDGGIGTVAMPVYYEHHEIFLCNELHRPLSGRATINGPGCFAADIVYHSKLMPRVQPGEVLAVMDSGAYFTSWESNFSHPRPAVVAVKDGCCRLLRRRESFEEMAARDIFDNVCMPGVAV